MKKDDRNAATRARDKAYTAIEAAGVNLDSADMDYIFFSRPTTNHEQKWICVSKGSGFFGRHAPLEALMTHLINLVASYGRTPDNFVCYHVWKFLEEAGKRNELNKKTMKALLKIVRTRTTVHSCVE